MLLDILNFAEMAHEIANTEKNTVEKEIITAGFDAEIAGIGRDLHDFYGALSNKSSDVDTMVLAVNSFEQNDMMTVQEKYIVSSLETAFALPIISM